VSDELSALSHRLQDVEKLVFDSDGLENVAAKLEQMQDMDLIIQQIADLGRAIRVVSDAQLEGAMLPTSSLGDTLHLNDLRQRLLGLSEDRLLSAPEADKEVFFF